MSATPRPWVLDIRGAPASDRYPNAFEQVHAICGPDEDIIVETDGGYYGPEPDDARFIVRAVNAFDALLAVAKQATVITDCEKTWDPTPSYLGEAVNALDAAHPGWREWA